jgi:hypothetical protein
MKKELLFQVKTAKKNFKIYTNGEIDGFSPDAIVNNRFPAIIDMIQAGNKLTASLCPTDSTTEEALGS